MRCCAAALKNSRDTGMQPYKKLKKKQHALFPDFVASLTSAFRNPRGAGKELATAGRTTFADFVSPMTPGEEGDRKTAAGKSDGHEGKVLKDSKKSRGSVSRAEAIANATPGLLALKKGNAHAHESIFKKEKQEKIGTKRIRGRNDPLEPQRVTCSRSVSPANPKLARGQPSPMSDGGRSSEPPEDSLTMCSCGKRCEEGEMGVLVCGKCKHLFHILCVNISPGLAGLPYTCNRCKAAQVRLLSSACLLPAYS